MTADDRASQGPERMVGRAPPTRDVALGDLPPVTACSLPGRAAAPEQLGTHLMELTEKCSELSLATGGIRRAARLLGGPVPVQPTRCGRS